MIRMIVLMALFAAGAILGPLLAGNMGYVRIEFIGYRVEMTVLSLLLSLAVLIGVIGLLEWLGKRLWRISYKLRHWRSTQSRRKARKATEQGLLAMAANDYAKAEKLITRGASLTNTPALNYLFAAEAAQAQGEIDQRDRYLEKAETADGSDDVAVLMTRARLYHQLGEHQQAVIALKQIKGKQARHPSRLRLLSDVLQADENWQEWLALLPQLRKQKVYEDVALTELYSKALGGYMDQLAEREGAQAVQDYWQQQDRHTRKDPVMLAVYARVMIAHDAGHLVQSDILSALKNHLHPQLLDVLRDLSLAEPEALLNKARRWRSAEQSEPTLYSALAHIAYQARQYDEALRYARQALQIRPDARDYELVAEVYEQQGQPQQALAAYRKRMALSA